jgi:hypothetical protein
MRTHHRVLALVGFAVVTTTLSHYLLSTLSKSYTLEDNVRRVCLLFLQPFVLVLSSTFQNLPYWLWQAVFYAQFPFYASVVGFAPQSATSNLRLRFIIWCHMIAVVGRAWRWLILYN